ncbi:MAG: polymerase sigma-70 factor, subfamily, partial [Chloroflexota bacterium]|nr:polymerase sigma-70 factor, subfamily [Chloroflexota bacterium]
MTSLHTVVQARNGDLDAFESLVIEHTPAVYRVARAIVGEANAPDVVQEVFLAAWRELPRLRDPARFAPWLQRICVNRCRSELRKRRGLREIPVEALGVTSTPRSFDLRPGAEARALIAPGLARLSLDHRTLIALHYAAGMPLSDV